MKSRINIDRKLRRLDFAKAHQTGPFGTGGASLSVTGRPLSSSESLTARTTGSEPTATQRCRLSRRRSSRWKFLFGVRLATETSLSLTKCRGADCDRWLLRQWGAQEDSSHKNAAEQGKWAVNQSQTPARHVEGHFPAGRSSSSSGQNDPEPVSHQLSRLLGEGDMVRQQSGPAPIEYLLKIVRMSLASCRRPAQRRRCYRTRKRYGGVLRARPSTSWYVACLNVYGSVYICRGTTLANKQCPVCKYFIR